MLTSSGGAVPVIDLAKDGATPESLAEAVKGAMTSVGFLFITNHGLEKEVEEMFATSQNFFENESESEKERCSYGVRLLKVVQVVATPLIQNSLCVLGWEQRLY